MRWKKNDKLPLDVIGLVIAGALFVLAVRSASPQLDLLVGIATSFVFLAVFDLLLAAQGFLLGRSRAKFFGRELSRGGATFAFPDFEPHHDVTRALDGIGMPHRYQRPTSKIRGLADFWIDTHYSAAPSDIEAILYLADIFDGIAAKPNLMMTDRRVIEGCDRSFLSVGLSSSACTFLYLERMADLAMFELIPEPDERPFRKFVRVKDGREFHSDSHRQYGLVMRHSPDPRHFPDRRWFIVGGIGTEGTLGAGWYLSKHWRYLAGRVPPQRDFIAVIQVPAIAPRSAYLKDSDIIIAEPDALTLHD
jgi:hypothetical protein